MPARVRLSRLSPDRQRVMEITQLLLKIRDQAFQIAASITAIEQLTKPARRPRSPRRPKGGR